MQYKNRCMDIFTLIVVLLQTVCFQPDPEEILKMPKYQPVPYFNNDLKLGHHLILRLWLNDMLDLSIIYIQDIIILNLKCDFNVNLSVLIRFNFNWDFLQSGLLLLYGSVSQTFFKWGPLLDVKMFCGPPYSCSVRKQF